MGTRGRAGRAVPPELGRNLSAKRLSPNSFGLPGLQAAPTRGMRRMNAQSGELKGGCSGPNGARGSGAGPPASVASPAAWFPGAGRGGGAFPGRLVPWGGQRRRVPPRRPGSLGRLSVSRAGRRLFFKNQTSSLKPLTSESSFRPSFPAENRNSVR